MPADVLGALDGAHIEGEVAGPRLNARRARFSASGERRMKISRKATPFFSSSETACRGKVNRTVSLPLSGRTHSGDPSRARADDRSNSAYCFSWAEPLPEDPPAALTRHRSFGHKKEGRGS